MDTAIPQGYNVRSESCAGFAYSNERERGFRLGGLVKWSNDPASTQRRNSACSRKHPSQDGAFKLWKQVPESAPPLEETSKDADLGMRCNTEPVLGSLPWRMKHPQVLPAALTVGEGELHHLFF